MIRRFVKKSFVDVWDELFLILLFDLFWIIGTILIIPWPFVTFGLFFSVKDIGDGKGVKTADFFSYGWRMWKPAYIWGGINLLVLIVVWVNIQFYAGIATQWSVVVRILFLVALILWVILQLVALALYPRLEEPSFKLALRNAAVLTARYPLLVLVLVSLSLITILLPLFITVFGFIISIGLVAVFANNAVGFAIKKELNISADDPNADNLNTGHGNFSKNRGK